MQAGCARRTEPLSQQERECPGDQRDVVLPTGVEPLVLHQISAIKKARTLQPDWAESPGLLLLLPFDDGHRLVFAVFGRNCIFECLYQVTDLEPVFDDS